MNPVGFERHVAAARAEGDSATDGGDGTPRVSVVVTAYNEGEAIRAYLDRLLEAVTMPCEVLVVYDDPGDSTAAPLARVAEHDDRVVPLLNTYGRGPARAIRYGIDHARAAVAVVTMADGCDDPMQIDQLARLVERGVVVAAASRYMRGGQQIGAPALKSAISRLAGRSLHLLARVGTAHATNSFKAYSIGFVRAVGIESDHGFEVGIELVAKARRHRLHVAEIPTIWLERSQGQSNFKLVQWLPHYLRWYRHAFGSPLALPATGAAGARDVTEPVTAGGVEAATATGVEAATATGPDPATAGVTDPATTNGSAPPRRQQAVR